MRVFDCIKTERAAAIAKAVRLFYNPDEGDPITPGQIDDELANMTRRMWGLVCTVGDLMSDRDGAGVKLRTMLPAKWNGSPRRSMLNVGSRRSRHDRARQRHAPAVMAPRSTAEARALAFRLSRASRRLAEWLMPEDLRMRL